MNRNPFRPRIRLVLACLFLAVLNMGAWSWAWVAAQGQRSLLGIALVIYGLGLRHAVDADHIAAIDNVTRKLMNERRHKPYLVGLWFAMGHSSVVTVIAVAVVAATTMLPIVTSFQEVGGTISTTISAMFLSAIAVMNVVIFCGLYRSYRRLRSGGTFTGSELELTLAGRGMTSRLLRPLFRLVTRGWHMFALGILFGLGFDTATEIAMYSVSAAQIAKGLPLHTVLVFPMLFAAGMSLVDTTDSVMMVGAYEWALAKPMRRLLYNMTITLVSIVVAIMIASIEALDLVAGKLSLDGSFWIAISKLKDNFNALGFAFIAVFALAWLLSFLVYRWRRFDTFDDRA